MADGQIFRAKVTRAGVSGVWITIASHWPGVEFGPCDLVANAVRLSSTVTGLADLIESGDDVLALATAPADFVIVGTIRTGVSPTGGL